MRFTVISSVSRRVRVRLRARPSSGTVLRGTLRIPASVGRHPKVHAGWNIAARRALTLRCYGVAWVQCQGIRPSCGACLAAGAQEPSQVMGVDVAGWGSLVLPGGGEPGQQRAHRSALVGKDPDVALRAGQRDRLGQRASVRPLDGAILRPDLPTGGAEWTRISPQDSTPMPPSGDAQAPRPLLACLGEGSTHTAAGQEPLPSEPSGARPVAPARAPPHRRALAGKPLRRTR